MSNSMITALQNPQAYPHPVDTIKLIETHISWILLTGKYAYKIKKPINYGFVDYSTLDKRHYFCEQEIKLNQMLTQGIYLQVLPITKTATSFEINGSGEIVEYALQMTEFSQGQLLNHLLRQHHLSIHIVEEIAVQLAKFHLQAEHAALDAPYGKPETVLQPVEENFNQARELLHKFNIANPTYLAPLEQLEQQSMDEFLRIKSVLQKRNQDGFTRRCHGDIHLGNITLINDKPVIFDCIEFNEYFIWTDVMGDVGFLLMDFYDHQRPDLGMRFLNTYLAYTGDYGSLEVLPYYFAYRAMVRSKIQLFSINEQDDAAKKLAYYQKYLSYVHLAQQYLTSHQPSIIMMHGLSGSGKSTVANHLAEQLGAIIIRSDVERKRLFNLQPHESSHDKLDSSIYQPDINTKTYEQLKDLAILITQAQYPVIVDATFLKYSERQALATVAKNKGIPYFIINCEADHEVLAARISARSAVTDTFSEASDLSILQKQQQYLEPLTKEEQEFIVAVSLNTDGHIQETEKTLKQKFAMS
jgi:aminoglycoside phosphotransferase family enzyme/predicted kinase